MNSNRSSGLDVEFTEAMYNIYRRALAEEGYPAHRFHQMLDENGGVETAKQLINNNRPSDGYTELYLKKRLDLTVEALVINDKKWHSLFTQEEIEKAKARLVEYEYIFPPPKA